MPTAKHRRKILCVFPAYSPSFGTFEYAYKLRGATRAFMPPQGLLVIAAYLPAEWEIRFVDENIRPARAQDFAWADAVLVSGMHVQRPTIIDIAERAHRFGKTAVLGGPSVSGAPELYGEFDYIHVGELGDGTERLIGLLDADPRRPPEQIRLDTVERLPLTDFPVPAYHLAEIARYFLGSVQFSSGCPYRCEFCDIPALYGRNPRLKTPQQVTDELDAMLEHGDLGAVYFVDDNFIGNRRAARELVEHLLKWQKARGYPIEFACEATLNIAKYPDLLALMREAFFGTIFCGIETPEPEALRAMRKEQNASIPMLEAIATLNSFGMEVVAGMIMGLDTDTRDTGSRIVEFATRAHIPMLTLNLLQALPKTPLWDRLAAEERIVDDPARESNVRFLLPYDDVVAMWRRAIAELYAPKALYERFAYNVEHTYPNRIRPPASPARASWSNIRKGMRILANLLLRAGVAADYRATFWRHAWPLLRAGRIEDVIHIGLVAHHLIAFSRDAVSGAQNASFYSGKIRGRGAIELKPADLAS
ncbi:MAG TPA: B12-binding domain-containing radical SAM protein [Stellaceae bacterium]|nr:B12-binding domain-containing radical SAM protein [Stellaceae bacterium]